MTQEEKAKAYDEAIEKLRNLYDNYDTVSTLIDIKEELEHIFPKLRESEGERIRKALIDGFTVMKESKNCGKTFSNHNIPVVDILAWLEKQGEQKPADKVEPKFNIGDWIVFNGLTLYVNEVVQGYYRTTSIGGIPNSHDWNIDNSARFWSIEDAKDGDVLATDDWVFIFEKLNTDSKPKSYCHYDIELGFVIDVNTYISTGSYIRPATKEQRDLLFQKMKEAGYEWDSESKQLIIPDKLFRFEVDLNTAVERYVEQHKSELNGYFDIRRIARHFFALGLKQKENKL